MASGASPISIVLNKPFEARAAITPGAARLILAIGLAAAMLAGFLATGAETTARAAAADGPDLARLLRGMAAIKAVFAAAAGFGIFWRLGSPAAPPWLAAYAVAGAAMAAGPGLIWGLAHVGLGALLLHAGLLGSVLLLWRDPVVGQRLATLVAARRQRARIGNS